MPERWRNLPPPLRWLVRALYAVVLYLCAVLVFGWIDGELSWGKAVGPVAAGLTAATISGWWQRRRAGDLVVPVGTAIRTGTLPDDADPAVWRPVLERRWASLWWAEIACYLVLLFVAGLWVANALRAAYPWATTALGLLVALALAALIRWWGLRQRRRIDRLEDQVAG